MTPNDFGPIYRETNMGQFPVEPWNTASNIIFLLTFFYWAYQIRHKLSDYKLMVICLPILFIGWVGGTVYHATRSHDLWLYMDFLPIFILGFILAFHYWYKLTKNYLKIFLMTLVPYSIFHIFFRIFIDNHNIKVTLGYFLLFAISSYPVIRYALNNRDKLNLNLIYASISFLIAITARIGDKSFPIIFNELFPMGTHWIWHTVGGLTTFFMFKFVFEDRTRELLKE